MNEEADTHKNDKKQLENGELHELLELDGIAVWGQHQSVLEKQALTHLQELSEKASCSKDASLEDGELSHSDEESTSKDENNSIKNITSKPTTQVRNLDINQYIANQQKLRQNHVAKKLPQVSEKSKRVADSISNRQINFGVDKNCFTNQKKKRKHSESSAKKVNKEKNYEISENSKTVQSKKKIKTDTLISQETNDNASGSEYYPSDDYNSDSDFTPEANCSSEPRKKKSIQKFDSSRLKDDGLLSDYETRLTTYSRDTTDEDFTLTGGLTVPGEIWSKLYTYQRDGIQWMWDLHQRDVGGLLGDEMGLGKTVQVVAFLASLQFSQVNDHGYCGLGPTIIACPVTVVHQWVKHFHIWWPPFRVLLLHNSSSNTANSNKTELIRMINRANGIVVTNYETVLKYKGVLCELKWHYIILDEGHKIRNPSAKITVAVKQFRATSHRLMLTGSPMQNNLLELWSLFDFIVPGRLGTQQAFMDHFATPITQGGYTNATPTQETTALLIATSLKDMISPYMLRRSKNDVGDSVFLPEKSEQVLFCSLTDEQRDLYKGFLLSDQVGSVLGRSGPRYSDYQKRASMLVAITTLRKICNHPDLYLGEASEYDAPNTKDDLTLSFGYFKRSGKMIVVSALLKIWKRQGHRVLLFTQSRSMLEIFEDMLQQHEYKYLKMDGTTTISSRQPLIDKFNNDSSYNVFLLTTRVGGLGVNLVGANRVIIYDPDWNPATDLQARERAWRIGQLKQVTVYRLLSAGTIEEKMYQRQVFKQLLSNKVLLDPRTQRFFKSSDLNELFSLPEETDQNPETANIFRNSKIEINSKKKSKRKFESDASVSFSEDKIKAMKEMAQQISKNLSKPKSDTKEVKKETEKRPTPVELLAINRKKLEPPPPEPEANKIDGQKTNLSFDTALVICTDEKSKNHDPIIEEKILIEENIKNDKKKKTIFEENIKNNKKKKKKDKVKIDDSGEVDGVPVEGLLKIEMKKKEKKKQVPSTGNQDDYVLEKLFSRKGVQTALQHDMIVQSGYKPGNNLKIHYEAKHKADMALKALRKSRLNNWHW